MLLIASCSYYLFAPSSNALVPSSDALVPSSDALVPSSDALVPIVASCYGLK